MAKTTSKVGPACTMHTDLELCRTLVHNNMLFCYIYLWTRRPAIDRSLNGMFELASLYYTCPDILGLVCERLSRLFASKSMKRRSLYGHWTCSMIWFLRSVRKQVWRSPVPCTGSISFLRVCVCYEGGGSMRWRCAGDVDNLRSRRFRRLKGISRRSVATALCCVLGVAGPSLRLLDPGLDISLVCEHAAHAHLVVLVCRASRALSALGLL